MRSRNTVRKFVLAGALALASTSTAATEPVLSGSFIQLNNQLVGLGESGWLTELQHMQAIGFDTVIVQYARYGEISYFPTGETMASEPSSNLPPTESLGTLTWHGAIETQQLRITVEPNSREWTMIPEVRVLQDGVNIAAGMSYELAPAPAGNYQDPDGDKLTDGFANFAWSDMVGWQLPGEITIDLNFGEPVSIDSVEVDFMRSDISGVELPASIRVSTDEADHGEPVGWSDSSAGPDMTEWNPIGELLAAAEQLDFRVWLGLSLDPAYWQGRFDPDESAELNSGLMHQLEALYGDSPALQGYYLPEEIDDRSFVTPEAHGAMIQYLAAMADAAHELNRPVMVAPYFGINPNAEQYAAWWDTTLETAAIDIIALQDGVGTRRTTAQEGVPVYRALREVTDRHGVQLWSDLEVFEQIHGWPVDELAWQAQPARIETVTEQLELEAPFVDKFVVFDFTHHMSPRLGGMAAELYRAYQDYLEERGE